MFFNIVLTPTKEKIPTTSAIKAIVLLNSLQPSQQFFQLCRDRS